jgi:hypothetical protein
VAKDTLPLPVIQTPDIGELRNILHVIGKDHENRKTENALKHLRSCLEQGMSVRQATNEPILYENFQIQSLLSEVPADEEPCS